jgi:glycosyltransferase involved in cell wall biosynthesis
MEREAYERDEGGSMLVTVVTPSLNGRRWLPACIDSTQAQAVPGVEVEHIFVDGASTDGTPEYAASRGCTVLMRDQPSLHAAINKGMTHANGELLGVLCCDDVLLPGALEAVVRQYRREGRRWLVGGCRWVDEGGRSLGGFRAPPAWVTAEMVASLGWSPMPHVYLTRDLARELGYYDATFEYSGDYELYVRALQREPFSRVQRPLVVCERHGGNLSMERNATHMAELAAVAEMAPPGWRRAAYQYLLKVWFNATNPSWAVHKHIGSLQTRRGSVSPIV